MRVPSTIKEAEDLLGGRVLAWVGGLAVLLGLVFLFALGISSGVIGETARTVIGAAGSAGLLALGAWLHERKARTDTALASVATGISGLFASITVAAQVYSLVPELLAVVLAIGVGAVGTALAVRWESRGIAALGVLEALSAPVLGGVGREGGTMALLFVALASAAGVLLWQRWNWLALAAFAVATPQWIAYIINGASALEEITVLVAFGALGMAVAVGHEVRIRAERLRALSAYLLALNAIVVAVTGWAALAHAGLGGHLALSLVSAASVTDLSGVLAGNEALSVAGATSVAALAAACLVSARITGEERLQWRIVLDVAGLACVALLTAMTLDGLPLVLAWAAAALTLPYLGSVAVVTPFESSTAFDSALLSAHQQGQMVLSVFWALVGLGTIVVGLRRDWDVARLAGLAVLGLSVTKVFLLDLATLTSLYRVVSFIGLGLLLAGAFIWQRLRPPALSDLRETPAGIRGR
jgi:uncharacterized membrane protein